MAAVAFAAPSVDRLDAARVALLPGAPHRRLPGPSRAPAAPIAEGLRHDLHRRLPGPAVAWYLGEHTSDARRRACRRRAAEAPAVVLRSKTTAGSRFAVPTSRASAARPPCGPSRSRALADRGAAVSAAAPRRAPPGAPRRGWAPLAWRSSLPKSLLVLAFLVGLSLALRTQAIHARFWIDEGLSVGICSHSLTDIPAVLRIDGSPPLYYMILKSG